METREILVEELTQVFICEAKARHDYHALAYSINAEDQAWRQEIRESVLPQIEADISALFQTAQALRLEEEWPFIVEETKNQLDGTATQVVFELH